jgi:hypothetical protein
MIAKTENFMALNGGSINAKEAFLTPLLKAKEFNGKYSHRS